MFVIIVNSIVLHCDIQIEIDDTHTDNNVTEINLVIGKAFVPAHFGMERDG